MKKITFLFSVVSLFISIRSFAQCGSTETLVICDMTTIDNDNNNEPDGIVNLYDEYTKLTGKTLTQGTWFDPDYNFALNESTGDLFLWDLKNSTVGDMSPANAPVYYTYELYTTDCGGDTPAVTMRVHVGPYSSVAIPAFGSKDINVQICQQNTLNCDPPVPYDLNQALLSDPSAHANGIWSYIGNSPNFVSIADNRYLITNVPYQPGPPLVDQETFELKYTVPGIAPCNISMETNVKISVIRDVQSGVSETKKICETDLQSGAYDADINLRDDQYLLGEDIEGLWQFKNDPTGQLTSFGDSKINLKEVYDDIVQNNPRFGCRIVSYVYSVENRSTVCKDKETAVEFILYEALRPFKQKPGVPEFCVNDITTPVINLYDYLEFTTENGTLYDYPNSQCTNWVQKSGPADVGLLTKEKGICSIEEEYTSLGTIDLSKLSNNDAGTYVFEYIVSSRYNCGNDPEVLKLDENNCPKPVNSLHPCQDERATVTIIINPSHYAGKNTVDLEFCESQFNDANGVRTPFDLITILETDENAPTIYSGSEGTWRDVDANAPITNPYLVPAISGEQSFNFEYTTLTDKGCQNQALLSFKVYEQYNAGQDVVVDVCSDETSFDLFSKLLGNPDTNGTWAGPDAFTSDTNQALFNPATSVGGEYSYTVPNNGTCGGQTAKVTVTVHQKPNTGNDLIIPACVSDNSIDLNLQLEPTTDSGGSFVDVSNTNMLAGTVVDLTTLPAGSYDFEYQIQGSVHCTLARSTLTLQVIEVPVPKLDPQSFCASRGATLADVSIDPNYSPKWYASIDAATTITSGEFIRSNTKYFVSYVDANGCESKKAEVPLSIIPLNEPNCPTGITEGISDNNDGINDELDLSKLPLVYPDYKLKIFNRYGSLVYQGDKDTPVFKGKANVAVQGGPELPTGIYFYVFNPNDGETEPIQGEIFLSR